MSDFKAKMHKIRFLLGNSANSAPPDPLAVFKGPTSKRREGKKEGRERGRKGKEREEKGKGGKGRHQALEYFGIESPLDV